MLFVLTGDIQMGKTRWLSALVEEAAGKGAVCCGVLSPGDWRRRSPEERADEAAGAAGAPAAGRADEAAGTGAAADRGIARAAGAGDYEKLGIDAVLLPRNERFPFARRADLAHAERRFDPSSQSARARLAWAIDDAAIERVNEHFEALSLRLGRRCQAGFLVVDELGALELLRGEGFSSALALLENGPSAAFPHALAVVRRSLRDVAVDRLSPAWGQVRVIYPGDEARVSVLRALGVDAPTCSRK